MNELTVYLKDMEAIYHTDPVIYTPYTMKDGIAHNWVEENVFYFDYDVIAMWGFQRFVYEMAPFEMDKLRCNKVENLELCDHIEKGVCSGQN
jgi:hypothetical protein